MIIIIIIIVIIIIFIMQTPFTIKYNLKYQQ